jgi:predicted transcriptional regulator
MSSKSLSLSKELDAKVERVARRLGKPRRTVLKEAIDEYARRHDSAAITEAMNRVADALDTRLDSGMAAAANRVLERTEW